MRNDLRKKGLVTALIILLLGIGVFPSIRANVVDLNTPGDTIDPLTTRYWFIAIGKIQDKIYVGDNTYQFRAISLFYMGFRGILLFIIHFYVNENISIHFDKKIGIFSDDVICGIFRYRT